MAVKPVPINVDYLKSYCYQKRLKVTDISLSMGMSKAFISKCIYEGKMLPSNIKHLCMLTGMDEGELLKCNVKDEQKPSVADDKLTETMTQNTELVITYIQDLGKIHSDLLREVKELKELEQSVLSGVQALVGTVKYGKH